MSRQKKIFKFIIGVFFAAFLLSGCATYQFHHGQAPHDKGYVVDRDDYTILEYTVSENNTVPNLKIAKERFNRRRNIVEDYYKRMGYISNHFKTAVWDPCIFFVKMVFGVLRLPFVAVSDYRYGHNPQYKERVLKLEAERELAEEKRINKLKEELNAYIQKDMAKEMPQKKEELKNEN